jgi:hypothetical protein
MMAIGLELSTDVDMAAIGVASVEGGRYLVDVVWYGSPDLVVAEASRLYGETDNVGVFADPQPCAGVLDALRAAGVWLHLMEATDVAAASWQYTTEVRARRVKGGKHPALREAMRAALRARGVGDVRWAARGRPRRAGVRCVSVCSPVTGTSAGGAAATPARSIT